MKQNLEKNQAYRKKEGRSGEGKRARLTQKAIVAVAAELFAHNGFGATSLDDIAEVLGVTKPALYYHVKNKEEILRLICLLILSIAEEPLQRIVESDLPPAEKLRRAIEHHIAIAANRSPALTVFYREQQHLTGPFRTVDSKIITFGLLGMCHWLSMWYKPSGRYTPQQIAEIFADTIKRGLIPSPPG